MERGVEGWVEVEGGGGSAFARAGKFLRLAVPPLPGNLTAPTKARLTAAAPIHRLKKDMGLPNVLPINGGAAHHVLGRLVLPRKLGFTLLLWPISFDVGSYLQTAFEVSGQ